MPRLSLDFITQNFVRSTNHEAPRYVIPSIPLLLPPLRPEYLPQKPYSRTPSAPQSETKFHTHKKVTGKTVFLYNFVFIFLDSEREN
jgi:hypothetical protein